MKRDSTPAATRLREFITRNHAAYGDRGNWPTHTVREESTLNAQAAFERDMRNACAHRNSVTTPDGHGAYCASCGETLA
jgi:hypothetical protein